ncbi:MAG: LapA family protein [Candidatus Dormibacteraeota bacterium]|nr:LapA family protein [Candidatus Dormibacteraeota bacterium]
MQQTSPPSGPPESTAATAAPGNETSARQPVASRISNLARLVIAAVVLGAVVLTVFCAQNTGATSVKFLVWSWPGAPLFVVILASVALGIAIGGLFVWLRLVRYSVEHRIPGRRQPRS